MRIQLLAAVVVVAGYSQSDTGQISGLAAPDPQPPELCSVDPRGRPEQDLVKVDNARYYVWFEGDEWHLRTACRALTTFRGSIRLTAGTFGRLRPIGLEVNAKNPDKWAVNADRTEIRFEIHTRAKFDGFDFDIRDAADGRIEYDLKFGADQRSMPRRIYIGPKASHPPRSEFALPADPTSLPAAAL